MMYIMKHLVNETKARFLEDLKVFVKMGAKEGIMLGFETMETSFMDTCA